MGEIFFVIKVFIITLVVVLVLQIKIGNNTIDQSIHAKLQNSTWVQPLEEVARGGVLMIGHAYRKTLALFDKKVVDRITNADAPGKRNILPKVKRYYDENLKERVDETTKETAQKFRDRLISEDDY